MKRKSTKKSKNQQFWKKTISKKFWEKWFGIFIFVSLEQNASHLAKNKSSVRRVMRPIVYETSLPSGHSTWNWLWLLWSIDFSKKCNSKAPRHPFTPGLCAISWINQVVLLQKSIRPIGFRDSSHQDHFDSRFH